jgi:hypothetical protein
MTMAELETAVRERAHVVALVFDNGRFGTIWRHQQERGVGAGIGTNLGPVDFAAVAEACGAMGISVRTDDEFEPALRKALEAGRPALLHLALDPRWTTPDAGPTDVKTTSSTGPEGPADVAIGADAERTADDTGEMAEAEPAAAGEPLVIEPTAVPTPDVVPEPDPDFAADGTPGEVLDPENSEVDAPDQLAVD